MSHLHRSRLVRPRRCSASSPSSRSTTIATGSPRTRRATRRTCSSRRSTFIEDFGHRLHAISPHFRADPRPHRRLAVPHLSRYALLQGQDAVQDDGRDPLQARARQGRPCARLLPAPGARRGVRRRRHLAPGHADADRDPRGDRRRPGWLAGGDRPGIEAGSAAPLKRVPTGFDHDHPLAEDLKRKDFAAYAKLSEADATAPGSSTATCARARRRRRSCASSAARVRVPVLAADAQRADHHRDPDHDQDRADDVEQKPLRTIWVIGTTPEP